MLRKNHQSTGIAIQAGRHVGHLVFVPLPLVVRLHPVDQAVLHRHIMRRDRRNPGGLINHQKVAVLIGDLEGQLTGSHRIIRGFIGNFNPDFISRLHVGNCPRGLSVQ